MEGTAQWYVVHTYSGYENTVKATIEKTVQSRNLQEQILAIAIPMETVTEISEAGVSKTYDRKLYPGYVFVKMVYSDNTWHAIRSIRGVSGFVGPAGESPIPLTEEETYEMGVEVRKAIDEDEFEMPIEKREIVVNYNVGDSVRILEGPFSSFTGVVETIEADKNSVSVVVTMFGRETSVKFELDQIEVITP